MHSVSLSIKRFGAGSGDAAIIFFLRTPVYITPGIVTEDRRRRSVWLV